MKERGRRGDQAKRSRFYIIPMLLRSSSRLTRYGSNQWNVSDHSASQGSAPTHIVLS